MLQVSVLLLGARVDPQDVRGRLLRVFAGQAGRQRPLLFFFGSICHSLLPYMVPAIIWLVGCGLSRLRNDEGLRDED